MSSERARHEMPGGQEAAPVNQEAKSGVQLRASEPASGLPQSAARSTPYFISKSSLADVSC